MAAIETHEKKDVSDLMASLNAVGEALRPKLSHIVTAELSADDAAIEEGAKKVHFIRHGQGHHNVAQSEWRAAGKEGEPFWVSTDPEFDFLDAELTPLGEQQAADLRPRTAQLDPEVMIVSPMRRATQTGLLAFEDHVAGTRPNDKPPMKVLAHEAAHEIAGKHTCDKRLTKTELAARWGAVIDYSLVEHEEDPFWGDGSVREPHTDLAARAAALVAFIHGRAERHFVVAAHSTILATLMNSVLVVAGDDSGSARSWFGTGEMRTFLLRWKAQ